MDSAVNNNILSGVNWIVITVYNKRNNEIKRYRKTGRIY